MEEFKLVSLYIELDNLLKAMGISPSGGEAKKLILAGLVKVNGEVEERVRRKLKAGDIVDVSGREISLVV